MEGTSRILLKSMEIPSKTTKRHSGEISAESKRSSSADSSENEMDKHITISTKLLKSVEELKQAKRQSNRRKKKLKQARSEIDALKLKIDLLSKKTVTATAGTQTSDEDLLHVRLIEATDPAKYEPFSASNPTESIADQLKSAAEQAISTTSFVFDENSGLYYDHSTKYYYDPEKKLYYDSSNGVYYSLDASTNSYVYHSKVNMQQYQAYYKHLEAKQHKAEKAAKRLKKAAKAEKKQQIKTASDGHSGGEEVVTVETDDVNPVEEMEDGEVLSDVSEDSETSESETNEPEILWRPPCVRMMVVSSEHLSAGSLYVVTIAGGWIGPDEGSLVQVPPEVDESEPDSAERCAIQYNESEHSYYLYMPASHKSSSITFNDQLLTQEMDAEGAQCERWIRLAHIDSLYINETTFSLHIHPGTDTCTECEPAIFLQQLALKASTQDATILGSVSKSDREKLRRKELKAIKKKYGLQKEGYCQNAVTLPKGYQDSAAKRREIHGVEFIERDAAPASVDVALSTTNVGHKMLAKMGWKEGESLGKSQSGIAEPVKVDVRLNQAAGLGSNRQQTASLDSGGQIRSLRNKAEIMKKTQKRYQSSQLKAFQVDESDIPE